MISSLLTVSPDNIPGGYIGMPQAGHYIIVIAILAIAITIISTIIIVNLHKKHSNLERQKTFKTIIIIAAICISLLFLLLTYAAMINL